MAGEPSVTRAADAAGAAPAHMCAPARNPPRIPRARDPSPDGGGGSLSSPRHSPRHAPWGKGSIYVRGGGVGITPGCIDVGSWRRLALASHHRGVCWRVQLDVRLRRSAMFKAIVPGGVACENAFCAPQGLSFAVPLHNN